MITVKAIFENNDCIITPINCTFEEATDYYLNRYLNLGVVEDNMQKCIKVELIEE